MTDKKDPGLVAIAGDWHGNVPWGRRVISHAASILLHDGPRILLQAGDFGVWLRPGERNAYTTAAGREVERDNFLDELEKALAEHDMELWFADGNHENHPLLRELTAENPYITPHIRYLERGTRWKWHNLTWVACGGAVSVDKLLRTEGKDWFREEEITLTDRFAVTDPGYADVLLSHDCPSWVPLKMFTPTPEPWKPQIPKANAHREGMAEIAAELNLSWIFHGHYHQYADQFLSVPWGECRVVSLDTDGREGNWGILNLKMMTWEPNG